MDQVWLEPIQDTGTLHFWQIKGQTNVIVQRKGESSGVGNLVSKGFVGQLFLGGFAVHGHDFDIVSSLLHEFQHFLETVGVSGNMSEGSWFHHETDTARRSTVEGRSVVSTAAIDGSGGHLQASAAIGSARTDSLEGVCRCQQGDKCRRYGKLHLSIVV